VGYECCHKEKSKDDTKRGAKVKRLRGETKNGPKKQIPNRGWDKTFKKKIDGSIERRE